MLNIPEPAADQPPRAIVTPLRIILFLVVLLLLWGTYFLYSVMYAPIRVATDYGAKAHEHTRARQNMPPDAPSNWEVFELVAQKIDARARRCSRATPMRRLRGSIRPHLPSRSPAPGRCFARTVRAHRA